MHCHKSNKFLSLLLMIFVETEIHSKSLKQVFEYKD